MAVRSISLPSRLHPTTTSLNEVECNLNKLESLELESSSISSLQARLVGLADLYVSLTDLIQTPSTQQSLFRHEGGRLVQEALDCSMALISTCSVSRDLVSSLKGHVRDLQSALRRSFSVESHAGAYRAFRKRSKKEAARCIKDLKQMEIASNNKFAPMFRQVVSVSIRTFRSVLLLLSVSVPWMKSKSSGAKWALIIARLVVKRARRSSNKDQVESVDVAICSIKGGVDTEEVQRRLRGLDCGSEALECAMEKVFRRLVQYRVSLLNILTH